jgi:HEAT repeat protein
MNEAPATLSLSDAERRRVDEIDLLTASGSPAVPKLMGMLTEPSWVVRRAVIVALGTLGEPAVAALCAYLRDDRRNETGIAAAIDALVSSSTPPDAALGALAKAANPAVLADVAQILGRRRAGASVATLIDLSTHIDDNVAVAALEALGRIGGRAAVEALIHAVQSDNFFRTFPAIDVLGRSGDPRALAPLAALLGNRRYSLEAARALGRTGDSAAVAPLAKLLGSPVDSDVRVGAHAMADLHTRYAQRYGTAMPIEEALRRTAAEPTSTRRLGQVLPTSDAAEQAAICLMLGCLGDEAAVPMLASMLTGAEPAVAQGACEAMKKIGRDIEPQILQMLPLADAQQRAVLLPLIRRRSSAPAVVSCLADADPDVRAAACDALARIGNASAAASLVGLLDDGNVRVAHAAAGAMQALGSDATHALVRQAARSGSAMVRRAALRILSYFGDATALPLLIAGIDDADAKVRDAAISGLPFVDAPAALEALVSACRNPDPRTRAAAIRAVGQCSDGERAAATLLAALDDADPWVRYYACQSLGRLQREEAVPAIAARLDDQAGQVRVGAVEALSHFPTDTAGRTLEAAAHSDDPDVRRAALVGLGLSKRKHALPTLLAAVSSADAATRLIALSAIAPFDDPDVVSALRAASTDSDPGVRGSALAFLASKSGPEAAAALLEIFCATPEDEAVRAVMATPSGERVGGVLAALRVADDELAPHLAWALCRMKSAEADAALIDALSTGGPAARKAAAPTLATLGSGPSQAALQQALADDPDPEVRRICGLLLTR